MNIWSAGAGALLLGLVPLGFVLVRAPLREALVALELAATIVVLVLVLLGEAYSRPSYTILPLALVPLSVVGGLLFARFLPTRR